jgi:hypothetical protein
MEKLVITEDDQAAIIANTGIPLTSFSAHAVERCGERNISLTLVVKILKVGQFYPVPRMRNNKLTHKVTHGQWKVIISKDGVVVSVVKRNVADTRKYEKSLKKYYSR